LPAELLSSQAFFKERDSARAAAECLVPMSPAKLWELEQCVCEP
jgi:hypothetical protein